MSSISPDPQARGTFLKQAFEDNGRVLPNLHTVNTFFLIEMGYFGELPGLYMSYPLRRLLQSRIFVLATVIICIMFGKRLVRVRFTGVPVVVDSEASTLS